MKGRRRIHRASKHDAKDAQFNERSQENPPLRAMSNLVVNCLHYASSTKLCGLSLAKPEGSFRGPDLSNPKTGRTVSIEAALLELRFWRMGAYIDELYACLHTVAKDAFSAAVAHTFYSST